MDIRSIIANSRPINNQNRIQINANNELQIYTTCDMLCTRPIDKLKSRNAQHNITTVKGETVTHHLVKRQPRQ